MWYIILGLIVALAFIWYFFSLTNDKTVKKTEKFFINKSPFELLNEFADKGIETSAQIEKRWQEDYVGKFVIWKGLVDNIYKQSIRVDIGGGDCHYVDGYDIKISVIDNRKQQGKIYLKDLSIGCFDESIAMNISRGQVVDFEGCLAGVAGETQEIFSCHDTDETFYHYLHYMRLYECKLT
jgi:hypothetical protein